MDLTSALIAQAAGRDPNSQQSGGFSQIRSWRASSNALAATLTLPPFFDMPTCAHCGVNYAGSPSHHNRRCSSVPVKVPFPDPRAEKRGYQGEWVAVPHHREDGQVRIRCCHLLAAKDPLNNGQPQLCRRLFAHETTLKTHLKGVKGRCVWAVGV